MHYAYFVSIPRDEADSAAEAIREAETFLDSNGFAGEGGLYSSSKADWYEIGGRWSGIFTMMLPFYQNFLARCREIAKEKYPLIAEDWERIAHYGDEKKDAQHTALKHEILALWKESTPKEYSRMVCPLARGGTFTWKEVQTNFMDSRSDVDDAQVLTKEQLENLLKEYADAEVVFTDTCEESTLETDGEKAIGRWIVIIDYHN